MNSKEKFVHCPHCKEYHPRPVTKFCPNTGKPMKNKRLVFVIFIPLIISFVPFVMNATDYIKENPWCKEDAYKIIDIKDCHFIVTDCNDKNKKKIFILTSSKKSTLIEDEDIQLYPSISQTKRRFVYQKGAENDAKICIVDLKKRRVIDCSISGRMPSISPNGLSIAYLPLHSQIKNCIGILKEDPNTGKFYKNTIKINSSFSRIWFPILIKNKKIAFVGRTPENRHGDIFLYDMEKKSIKQLTKGRKINYITASWDNELICYTDNKAIKIIKISNTNSYDLSITGDRPVFSCNDKILYFWNSEEKQIFRLTLTYNQSGMVSGYSSYSKEQLKSSLREPDIIISLREGQYDD